MIEKKIIRVIADISRKMTVFILLGIFIYIFPVSDNLVKEKIVFYMSIIEIFMSLLSSHLETFLINSRSSYRVITTF